MGLVRWALLVGFGGPDAFGEGSEAVEDLLDFPVEPIVFFEGLASFDLGEDQVVVQGVDLVEQVVGPFDLGGEWVTVGSLETRKGITRNIVRNISVEK